MDGSDVQAYMSGVSSEAKTFNANLNPLKTHTWSWGLGEGISDIHNPKLDACPEKMIACIAAHLFFVFKESMGYAFVLSYVPPYRLLAARLPR